jgi:hypothetical protein
LFVLQVPTKVFSLQNSTAYVYPKANMCVLLELGASSSIVTLSNCEVMMHFDTESDMGIFLKLRRRVLGAQGFLPPPDGIFLTWIVFDGRPNSTRGSGEKTGRYAVHLEHQKIMLRKKNKNSYENMIELKLADCRFAILSRSIMLSCFLGELEIYSADDFDTIKDWILKETSTITQ